MEYSKGAENYKDTLYKNYRSTHNSLMYGELSLDSIRRSFPVWRYYYKKHLPANKGVRILEIGCGDGAFVYFLQQEGFTNALGIDVSPEQVAVGEALSIGNLRVANAGSFLRESETKYDLIIARDVIEHFTKQETFDLLSLISSRLNIGGQFVMQVPNGEGIFYTSIFFGDYTHEMAYTTSSIRQLFLNTGFSRSQCYSTGPVPHSFLGWLRKFLWNLRVLVHRFWKMVETGNPYGIFTSNLIAIGTKA